MGGWLAAWEQRRELPSVPDMAAELMKLSDALNASLSYQRKVASAYVEADTAYRRLKAELTLRAADALMAPPHDRQKPSVDEKAAWVDSHPELQQLRARALLADEMRWANKEALAARKTQISTMQTLLNALRAEIEFERGGGTGGA